MANISAGTTPLHASLQYAASSSAGQRRKDLDIFSHNLRRTPLYIDV